MWAIHSLGVVMGRKRRQARTEVPKEAEATKLQSSEELPSRDSVRYLMRFLIRRLIEGEEHQPYALLRVPCGWKKESINKVHHGLPAQGMGGAEHSRIGFPSCLRRAQNARVRRTDDEKAPSVRTVRWLTISIKDKVRAYGVWLGQDWHDAKI